MLHWLIKEFIKGILQMLLLLLINSNTNDFIEGKLGKQILCKYGRFINPHPIIGFKMMYRNEQYSKMFNTILPQKFKKEGISFIQKLVRPLTS